MALIDNVINTINTSLLANLSWLDNAYGKIQRMKGRDATGKEINFPGVYVGINTDDYVNVLPDQNLGKCYCYFEVSDPSDYDIVSGNINVSFNFKIAFWFDWRQIYPSDYKVRSIEEIKGQILTVLKDTKYTRTIEIFKMYEDANSIFQNFTNQGYISSYDHKIITGQFMMKPYGGVAVSGRVHSMPTCVEDAVAPVIPIDVQGMIPFDHSFTEQVWAIEKWFGSKMYCRTWFWATGTDVNVAITGLLDSYTPIRASLKTSISTNDNFPTAELEKSGGVYNLFISSQQVATYLTVWYKK